MRAFDPTIREGPGSLHHIKLTKTADKGTLPDHPIFEGYTIWGYAGMPKVGECYSVLRYRRNDVESSGIMTTTPVTSVEPRGWT